MRPLHLLVSRECHIDVAIGLITLYSQPAKRLTRQNSLNVPRSVEVTGSLRYLYSQPVKRVLTSAFNTDSHLALNQVHFASGTTASCRPPLLLAAVDCSVVQLQFLFIKESESDQMQPRASPAHA